jgi:peptidoglycan/LPS O-acetylase OafA/YrhL
MQTEALVTFLQGATTMGCLALSVFFLRFWWRSHDRLFAIFALAFLVFAINRALLVVLGSHAEEMVALYAVRAAAFGLILLGILDANRKRPDA